MLQHGQAYLSSRGIIGFMLTLGESAGDPYRFEHYQTGRRAALQSAPPSDGESEQADGEQEAPLDDAARGEREYVRQRLREELKRDPTESELDEWLRQHTEGY